MSLFSYCLRALFFLAAFILSHYAGWAQPFNGFLKLDGVDDELSIDASDVFMSPDDDFTLEFWFRLCDDTLPYHQVLIGNEENLEVNMFPGAFGPPELYLQVTSKGTTTTVHNYQEDIDTADIAWHHIAITYYRPLERFTYFLDGVEANFDSPFAFDFPAQGDLIIAKSNRPNSIFEPFNGYIDEMRISNVVRYTGPAFFTPPTQEFIPDSNTIALWHFNDANPLDSALDVSGNNIHFVASGNPVIVNINTDELVTQSEITLTAVDTFDGYQWVDCDKQDEPIVGATSHLFTPSTSGNYAVLVYNGSCPFKSNCFNVMVTGVEVPVQQLTNVYPNPVTDLLNIQLQKSASAELTIYNTAGKLVHSESHLPATYTLDMGSFATGVYHLQLVTDNQAKQYKILKL